MQAKPDVEQAGQFMFFGVAIAATPEMGKQGLADALRVTAAAIRPWSNGRSYLNFAEDPVDPSTGYDPASFARLRHVRAAVDAGCVMVANHLVPAASAVPAQR